MVLLLPNGAKAQFYNGVFRLTTPTGESITPTAVVDSDDNEKVRVVGYYINGTGTHACLWTASGFLELPPLRTSAEATAVNQSGQIYGVDFGTFGTESQVIGWTSAGVAFAPTPPAPYTLIGAIAVNNFNAVVSNGYVTAPDGTQTNYGSYVLANGGVVRLSPLNGNGSAEGYGINDNGWVVGRSDGGGVGSPVLWIGGGTPISLGTLGGTDGWAFGINNSGQAVGYSRDSGGRPRAFLWQNNVMNRLPGGDAISATAYGINDAGVAVGVSDRRAVSWTNGLLTDLNRYAPAGANVEFTRAAGISGKGAIIVLGTVIGSGGTPANYVLIPIETATVAVDLNRDGAIKFDDSSDTTSTITPSVFWTNDDVDLVAGKDEQDFDPNRNLLDYQDLQIRNKRDLEDFTRVHLRAPTGFDPVNGQWTVTCELEAEAGNPGINLYAAVTDSTSYLADTTVADQQIAVGGSSLTLGKILPVDPRLFTYQDRGSGALYAPLLFEGRTPGKFTLVARFTRNGTPVAEARCWLDVRRMSEFYDHFTVGDTTTRDVSKIPDTPAQIQTATVPTTTNDYILFVHGWRLQPWERRAFAETAYKRLWHLGYKGGFGLYSWPTEYIDGRLATVWKDKNPLQNYDRSEEKAWRSASGLRVVLHAMSSAGLRVHLLAHSMGNVVASEALELEGESANPQLLVANYAATQAATVAHAYDPSTPRVLRNSAINTPNAYAIYPLTQGPYFSSLRPAAGRVINLHNRVDYALNYWLTNQKYKPDVGWGYSAAQGFYRNGQSSAVLLSFPQNRGEIFSFVAQAWSNALGREPQTMTGITISYDLNAAPVNFGGKSTEHSGQFNSTFIRRHVYWSQLGRQLLNIEVNETPN